MVRHIVFWNLKEEADGRGKWANAKLMKEKLESLVGQVEGLRRAEVGFNFTEGGYDVSLVAEHDSREALAVYQKHPAHLAVKEFVHKVICARAVCDCEL